MSGMTMMPAGSLFSGAIRLFVAPVNRAGGAPAAFDPAAMGNFALADGLAGWLDAGTVTELVRSPGQWLSEVKTGSPAVTRLQARTSVDETLAVTFAGWSRMAIAMSSGMQTMNLLRTVAGAAANASGGSAVAAEAVNAGSTAIVLQMDAATTVQAGDVLAVDVDYAGQTGFIGSGTAGAYLQSVPEGADANLVRRTTFNVARVSGVSAGAVTLDAPLPAGAPAPGMKAAVVQGFADRNGGSFLQEWSALFVVDGLQGDRLLLHYPRLQPAGIGTPEASAEMAADLFRWRPTAHLRAMPVTDANDGVEAVCFRSYLPAPGRKV